ncbi:Fic family protein [Neorhizobium galegae]|uniref:Fic family protein n=1 Tax=Neorhizobium galegae TaxID=399 RepID=UPI0006213327|nr:Fic family protein [Neorhizobium galegae]KAB1122071.1 Fic family protein [Neorhizobium galegae]MCQ1810518.1 Fic family protein [Neorhizobium galegae]CDZ62119.1 Filamentation induced by cAMP protein Fic [Neorhizobium galegae bv. orientalis]
MIWNWQQAHWPNYTYNASALEADERQFLINSGELIGAFRHINADERDLLRIELIGDEALTTSEIEGEVLNRDSLQSSLRRQFGLGGDDRGVPASERGIAEMMVDLYNTFASPLTHDQLHAWHRMIMADARRIDVIGGYRTRADAMQIVSGYAGRPKVHFEAPPSAEVPGQMDQFLAWFNSSAPLPALTRAGIAHLYFESIHPFEDGNGRIGRAIAEKALAQSLGQPSLIALSFTIARSRKRYYDMLEASNTDLAVTDWLVYFGETVLAAQQNTMQRVAFHITKAHFFDHFGTRLNERQQKAMARMFREGIDGFKGGLSAENYISITKASRATATRDLQDLVEMGALTRTGERRYTRYHLQLA